MFAFSFLTQKKSFLIPRFFLLLSMYLEFFFSFSSIYLRNEWGKVRKIKTNLLSFIHFRTIITGWNFFSSLKLTPHNRTWHELLSTSEKRRRRRQILDLCKIVEWNPLPPLCESFILCSQTFSFSPIYFFSWIGMRVEVRVVWIFHIKFY